MKQPTQQPQPSLYPGILGLAAFLLFLALALTGCDPSAAAAPASTQPAPAPLVTATPTLALPPTPCALANCGQCQWRQGEGGEWAPFLVYVDGRPAERMDIDPNHAWNIDRACPARPTP